MSIDFSRARWSVAFIFFVNGCLLGSWAPQIPLARERLGLSGAELGLALLFVALGAVLAMLPTGALVARYGSGTIMRFAIVAQALLLPFLALASSLPAFDLVCFVFGIANGFADVTMNTQAIEVERGLKRPVMSGTHGMFSLGGFVGAGIAALLLPLVAPPVHMAIVSAALLAGLIPALPGALPASADTPSDGPAFALPGRAVLLIGGLTFLAFMAEGAIYDWSAVFMRLEHHASESLSALAFSGFSCGMAAGRFAGDGIRRRVSAVRLLAMGAALAAVAIALALFGGSAGLAVTAFAVAGLGVANIVPLLFLGAGQVPGQSPAAALAAATTMGYSGFLIGPPAIGFLSDHIGIGAALATVSASYALVALAARRVAGGRAAGA